MRLPFGAVAMYGYADKLACGCACKVIVVFVVQCAFLACGMKEFLCYVGRL